MIAYEDVLKVKERHKIDLMSIGVRAVTLKTGQRVTRPNVVGVGVGRKLVRGRETEELSIAVSVIKKLPETSLRREEIIPKEIGWIKTDVIETSYMLEMLYANVEKFEEMLDIFKDAEPFELKEV